MPKANELMEEACKNASINNPHVDPVTEEFCLRTLLSDNRSMEAKDLRELLLVAVDILRARVAATGGMVNKMLENTRKGTVPMRVLSFCEVDYESMLSILKICDAMIRDYQGGEGGLRSNELASYVDMAYDCVDECGSELDGMPLAGALVNENNKLGMLVKLNTALVAPRRFLE
ncbi:hypothetical protein ZWY2020_047655 [Hordeum vulgare]|nr:hypothetical protein ZWY2020_047655 [Hordeum vulgare]